MSEAFAAMLGALDRARESLESAASAAGAIVERPVRRPFAGGYWLRPGRGDPLQATLDVLDAHPKLFAGVVLELRWCEWEPILGRRDYGRILECRDACRARGVQYALWAQWQDYNGTLPLTPQGVMPVTRALAADGKTIAQWTTPLYLPQVAAALAGSLRALAITLESDGPPGFVTTSESGAGHDIATNAPVLDAAGNVAIAGYDKIAMLDSFDQIYEAIGQFQLTPGFACINSFAGKESTLVSWASNRGLGIHRTDAMPTPVDDRVPIAQHPRPRLVEVSQGAIERLGVDGAWNWALSYGADGLVVLPWHESFPAVLAKISPPS